MSKPELQKTVLIVDDEEVILDIVKNIMEKWGYTVLLANNGKEAVRVYQKSKDHIDLVILDMILHDIGGDEIYIRMKAINPEVKVLLASGYGIDSKVEKILASGATNFIQKPFNIMHLSEKVKEVFMEG